MHTLPSARWLRVLAAILGVSLLVAACGTDDDGAGTSGSPATVDSDTGEEPGDDPGDSDLTEIPETVYPLTVISGGLETTIEEEPLAIVTLSPTATEMVFAIGEGGRVVAADSFSNFPAEAPTTSLSAFTPNVEAIIEFEPDLVILAEDRDDVVAGLAAVGVPSLLLPSATTLEDTYDQIELLGRVTDGAEVAAGFVDDMRSEIDDLVALVPERDEPLTYYHELSPDLFTATSDTFIGAVYSLAGLTNVADAADPDGEAGGFPQLSAEFLLDADPDLVFLADTVCCDQDADFFGARPGFDVLSAVRNDLVFEQNDDIASRWGPRIVDFLEVVIEATAAVDAG